MTEGMPMIRINPIILIIPCLLVIGIYLVAGPIRKRSPLSVRHVLDLGLILYSFTVVATLFFPLEISTDGSTHPSLIINLIPLRQILRYISQATTTGRLSALVRNVIGNLVVFAPLAILLVLRFPERPRRSFLLIALVSLLAEPLQGILQLLGSGQMRVIDIDDLLLNAIGGIGTWCICFMICRWRKRRY